MRKIVSFLLIIFFVCGCGNDTNIKEDISIDYPVTNIQSLDEEISSYISKIKKEFKYNNKRRKLNISYTFKEIDFNTLNICIHVSMVTDKEIHKIKTYTYDKRNNKFLAMEDLVRDIDILDYDVKKLLVTKYQELDMELLNNVSLDYFEFNDDNLRLFFNPDLIKNNNDIIHLDIPLNNLDLVPEINNNTYFSIKKRNINIDDKVVALTFDDGPSGYTSGILDILKEHEACATFFVVGERAYYQGDTLKRIINEGSEIGNHSFDHKVLTYLSEEEFKSEIDKTQKIVKNITGFTPTLFRPTYGGYTERLKGLTDLLFVLWDVDSRDWKVKNKEKIINNTVPYIKSGSIVLFHDNHDYALKALNDIILNLKEKGFKFVTVSELLEFKKISEEN